MGQTPHGISPQKEDKSSEDDASSALEHYKIIRAQIEHEDNLINQRLSWFVTSQSFLFTAYALLLNAPVQVRLPEISRQQNLLFLIIPLVAICTGLLIYTTIAAAMLAMHHLRVPVREHASRVGSHDLPPVEGYRQTHALGHAAPLLMPLVFIVVWCILLARLRFGC